MSSSAVTFDRLAYIDRLREALDAALRDTVATKTDIDLLRAESCAPISQI